VTPDGVVGLLLVSIFGTDLLSFLYTVTEDCVGDRVIEAKGLLALIDFKFVLLLHMFCDLLSKIRIVSVQLQNCAKFD